MPPDWFCQDCGHEGDREDFNPTDGQPDALSCPECGSPECFPVDDTVDHTVGGYDPDVNDPYDRPDPVYR